MGTTDYTYDANGNMIGDSSGRTFTYSAFDQMTIVTKGTNTLAFTYGADRQRNYRSEAVGGSETKTFYLGSAERVELPNGTTEVRRRIGGEVLIIETLNSDGTVQSAATKHRYQLLDHLGSPIAVYDGNADMKERLSFGSWGNRRDYVTLTALAPYTNPSTETVRGYTGHEHGDAFGIIHMNGRIYDPQLGRMLQADPFIQAPTDTQSYNRYGYVRNNPLRYTDPSGYSWEDWAGPVIAVVGTLVCGNPACAVAFGAAAGGASAAANGGKFIQGAIIGGISAGAFYQAGAAAGQGWAVEEVTIRVVGYGAIGGVASVVSGGKFHHGFIAAGAGGLIGGTGTGGAVDAAIRTIGRAIVGGTASEITGGKFANGAATAAFASIVAESVATRPQPTSKPNISDSDTVGFVGGAADDTFGAGVVRDQYEAYRGSKEYFEWTDANAILAYNNAHGGRVTWVTHSYGADEIAHLIAGGMKVHRLITVDPVGWTRPGMLSISNNVVIWNNFDSTGTSGSFWNNLIATVGGAWNSLPSRYATTHKVSNSDHVRICYEYCTP